jgi:endonuclease YncB( thermonuclease family)
VGCVRSPLTVQKVVYADTVILNDGTHVQYAGLEGPSESNLWFHFCRDANAYLVQDRTVELIPELTLSPDGIIVAYVYIPILVGKETQYLFVNAEMVKYGFAKALPLPSNCHHKELWQSLWDLQEQEAKTWKQGIWSGKEPP